MKPQPLVLVVVDDPALGKAIAREWLGRTEETLTVRDATLGEVAAASRLPGDAVVFPTAMLGQLAERGLIAPLESGALEGSEFDYRDIFDQIRLREMRWGGKTLAVPLGSPQLLLAYRADVFERNGLSPPHDWAEYQQVLDRLANGAAPSNSESNDTQRRHPAIEPLAEGWAGQLLLARAAAYAVHRDQISPLFRFDNLAPLIDQPPYVRALEELVNAAKAGHLAKEKMTPPEAFQALRSGRCAMALTWAASNIDDAKREHDAAIRFALLPGAKQAYRFATQSWEERSIDDSIHVPLLAPAGRMAAASDASSDARRAQGLVIWLSGREVSQQTGPHSAATTLFRNSQIPASTRWTGSLPAETSRQYAETLRDSLSLSITFPALALPGRLEYLPALDKAVHEALGGKPAAEALADAAKQWTAITERLGVESQRRANAKSLGQRDL
jgi:multiple sugar transport system substrate-binding protein